MSAGLAHVLFLSAFLLANGAFVLSWRREATAALAGLPLMLGGALLAFVGVARFAASSIDPVSGQALAVALAVAATCWVGLGLGLIGREASR